MRLAILILWLGATLWAAPAADQADRQAPREVLVLLWFDTEDYLLPADDDATLRLCEMLSARGIRATFKLVGEKARVLERRGRQDVLAALRRHAIGYHANFHSVHPTPTEYLADCGWLEGVEEFVRREGGGAADVRRILNVPALACYGQPGSSWAPQAIAALRRIGVAPHGVPCYVDEGSHVGLNHRPFWYAGALNVYNLGPNCLRMELHNPAAVEPAKREITATAERLGQEGGGLISIYYHPCEWVHQEFWDGVNFRRGANPPREQWKAPPQRPAAETEAAFQRFGQYIDHIRALPGTRWITAEDLPGFYPDMSRTTEVTPADLTAIAQQIATNAATGLDTIQLGGRVYSLADQFGLLATAVDEVMAGRSLPPRLSPPALLGPDGPPPATGLPELSGSEVKGVASDARRAIEQTGRVPARVFAGAHPLAPGDVLTALAKAWSAYAVNQRPMTDAERLPLSRNVRLLPERYVAEDTPGLFGGWIIHPEGFRAPHVMEQARLQAWTLKPALRAP